MSTKTNDMTRAPILAAGLVLLALLLLWISQPLLPVWACSASLPGVCPSFVSPIRASVVSFMLLFALLAAVIVGLAFRPRSDHWLDRISRITFVVVPLILILTVIAHFTIPQR